MYSDYLLLTQAKGVVLNKQTLHLSSSLRKARHEKKHLSFNVYLYVGQNLTVSHNTFLLKTWSL